MVDQVDIDQRNAAFWDELCGSNLAQVLGITTRDSASLTRYDRAYMDLYPYLPRHVPFDNFAGQRVLEIGLGYGTLGQKIAEHCGEYVGLDIAAGPVAMMNYRLEQLQAHGQAQQGSMLTCPFPDESFDAVVSIGCFHHTGNLQRCIDETRRVLKPGGTAYVMVYNKFNYRNWLRWPLKTLADAVGPAHVTSVTERAAYDANAVGDAAPETVFTSRRELAQMFGAFSTYADALENWSGRFRPQMLGSAAHVLGLDIYARAAK